MKDVPPAKNKAKNNIKFIFHARVSAFGSTSCLPQPYMTQKRHAR